MKILSWSDVAKTHRTNAGISTKDGLVKSLLCNFRTDQLYPNTIKNGEINYCVGPQTQTHGINALFGALEKGNAFPIFEKVAVNNWKYLGDYKAVSVKELKKGYVSFKLSKS